MLRSRHRFYVHLLDENGAGVCRQETSGFQPVYEDLLFTAVRSGLAPNDGCAPAGSLEPVWRDGCVSGVVASLVGLTKTYPLDIFQHEVRTLLLDPAVPWKSGGDSPPRYRWKVDAEAADQAAGPKFPVRMRRRPYPFADHALSSLGVPAPDRADQEHLRLFVAEGALEQLRRETAASLSMERADVLCGLLLQDQRDTALVVTSRFPLAFQTEASAAHVAFSPLTFQAARRELERRGDGAGLVGWHHNHPPKCGSDCEMVVPACDNDSVFLSVDDYAVFLASFCAPYMIGLISGKGKGQRAGDPIVRAYGWRDAVVREIDFTVLGE